MCTSSPLSSGRFTSPCKHAIQGSLADCGCPVGDDARRGERSREVRDANLRGLAGGALDTERPPTPAWSQAVKVESISGAPQDKAPELAEPETILRSLLEVFGILVVCLPAGEGPTEVCEARFTGVPHEPPAAGNTLLKVCEWAYAEG